MSTLTAIGNVGKVVGAISDIMGTLSDGQSLAGVFVDATQKKKLNAEFVRISKAVFKKCDDCVWIKLQSNNYAFLKNLTFRTIVSPNYLNVIREEIASEMDHKVQIKEINLLIIAYYEKMKQSKIFDKYVQMICEAVREKNGNDAIFFNGNKEIGLDIIDKYSGDYDSVMFLQKLDEVQLKLKDLYVENDYKTNKSNLQNKDAKGDRFSLVHSIYDDFDSDDERLLMIVEGDAGVGKTSLVSRIAYDYNNRHVKKLDIWNRRKLLIVKLRELNLGNQWNSPFREDGMAWSAIMSYFSSDLKGVDKRNTKLFFDLLGDFVLVLDGYDELCILNRNGDRLGFIHDLVRNINSHGVNCKIMITSRPNYIGQGTWGDETSYLRDNNWKQRYITLEQFDKFKRRDWLRNAEEKGFIVEDRIADFLTGKMNDDVEVVASTPFTMYLIAHEKIDLRSEGNLWAVYNRIFNHALIDKQYETDEFGNPVNHPKAKDKATLIEITKSIACKMFELHQLMLTNDLIDECIKGVVKSDDSQKEYQDELKSSYALFCYYRTTGEGGIEFYHNYIQEFYLAEVLYEKLTQILKNKNLETVEKKLRQEKMLTVFDLPSKVMRFLEARVIKCREEKGAWDDWERQNHFIGRIFVRCFYNGHKGVDEAFTRHLLSLERMALADPGDFLLLPAVKFYRIAIDQFPIVMKSVDELDCKEIIRGALRKTGSKMSEIDKYLSESNGEIYPWYIGDPLFLDFDLMSDKRIDRVVFRLLNIPGVRMEKKYIYSCLFAVCDMRGSQILDSTFAKTNMAYVTLSGSAIRRGKFDKCHFANVKFDGATLYRVVFDECSFENVTFSGAFIRECRFNGCSLEDGIFEKATFIS